MLLVFHIRPGLKHRVDLPELTRVGVHFPPAPTPMLNHEHFDRQAAKLALDIHHITARHAGRLKKLYYNAAVQIFELAHNETEPVPYMNHLAPADVAAEIWTAYKHRFSYLLEQK